MTEFELDIATAGGAMNSYVMHPEEGGPFPVALCYMDSCGLRDDFLDLPRRLASAGYCVITPNAYYRRAREVDLEPSLVGRDEKVTQAMWEFNRSITVENHVVDTAACLKWADGYEHAMNGPVGVFGYCLGGRLALTAAAHFPDRIVAAASFHGAGFVKDDLSHAPEIRAEIYLAQAGTDEYVPIEKIERIERVLTESGVQHRFEVFTEAHHGFSIPGRLHYHRPSAERSWERLFALFRRNLPQVPPRDGARGAPGIRRI